MKTTCLPEMGNNLKAARKKAFPGDDLAAFAVRIGVSRATLQKMEKGDMSVSLVRYYQAASLLGVGEQIEKLFFKEPSLFDKYPDALVHRSGLPSSRTKADIAATTYQKPGVPRRAR